MINIAFTHEHYPQGGAEKITSILAEYLVSHGYRVYMFVEDLKRELLSESDKKNIEFIFMPYPGKNGRGKRTEFIADKINELGIDILVSPGVPLYNNSHIKRTTKAKLVFAHHSLPMWELKGYYKERAMKVWDSRSPGMIVEWYLLRLPRNVLTGVHKEKIRRKYRTTYCEHDLYTVLCDEYKRKTIEVLGSGVATAGDNHIGVAPNYLQPRDYGTPEKKKQVLYVGRLALVDKRVDRLLDIWAMVHRTFPDWELLLVGGGRESESLMRRARKLGLTNVTFCGETDDPSPYYRDASIVCLTSTFEGWPLVIAEGQQAGCVPIAFDVVAGIRDQIEPDGVNGMLVRPFDKKEYARKLSILMSDDSLRGQMSRNVVAKSKAYSNKKILENWDKLLRGLLS